MTAPNTLEDVYRVFDSIVPDKYGCHQWPRAAVIGYYCKVSIEMQSYKVHRLALERKLGRPIRSGFECRHTCDCKSCVNPEHLEEGTHKENMEDRALRYPESYDHFKKPKHPAHRQKLKDWSNSPENKERLRQASLARWEKHRERQGISQ